MRRAVNRPRLAGTVVAGLLLLGCRSAANTFLDLPPASGNGSHAGSVTTVAQTEARQELPPPPIESVVDLDSVLALLPTDNAGYTDWVEAQRSGVIRPRGSAGDPDTSGSTPFGFDFFLQGEKPMMDAFFPHSAHTAILACGNCHPDVYTYRGTETTMQMISEGQSCGVCHGKVAFPVDDCERCHTRLDMTADRVEPVALGDLVLPRRGQDSTALGAGLPPAEFSHTSHRVRYRCSACHPDPFPLEVGATEITMAGMAAGETCGTCHSDSGPAFAQMQCSRCHAEPARDVKLEP